MKSPPLPQTDEYSVLVEFQNDRYEDIPDFRGASVDLRERRGFEGRTPDLPRGMIHEMSDIPFPGASRGTAKKTATAFIPERISYPRTDDQLLPEISGKVPIASSEDIFAQVMAEIGKDDIQKPAESGITQPDELEWKGKERKLIKKPDPQFPDILLQEGQEVDVKALFTVAPTGQVIRVEIIQSSGYTMVDRAVERALFDYFFEESHSDTNDFGAIQFHFRLERLD
ncbi:unnamed protein product [marine sediment metagenome]|uniref:TonB C-terminal domain-containing protein n=1 Tax=marine sediment metagenome TaxID=412755 RepID=X1EAD2_9ZZZZ